MKNCRPAVRIVWFILGVLGIGLMLWGLTRIDPIAGMPIVVGWCLLGITRLWDAIAECVC